MSLRQSGIPVNLNGDHLIRLPLEHSRENYLRGFWQWVTILSRGDYQAALEALHWPSGTTWTPADLKDRVETFFGGKEAWSVVIPNDRLIGVIDDAADCQPASGWFLAQVPLTTEPADPKSDTIPLMGLAASFFVRPHDGSNVLEFEIFHA
jgi:hypothetical protein